MSCRPRSLPAASIALLFSLLAAPAAPQGELVLHKEGAQLYHRPHCPVVRDVTGVLALNRGQAEARGFKPHPECDPANEAARKSTPAPPAPPPTVYLDGSKYYHRKDCAKLKPAKQVEGKSLDVAGRTHWPCPTCRPPVRRRTRGGSAAGAGGRGH